MKSESQPVPPGKQDDTRPPLQREQSHTEPVAGIQTLMDHKPVAGIQTLMDYKPQHLE